MQSSEPKKLALLYILKILERETDEAHPLYQEEIAGILEREYGVLLERKAIGRNLSLLAEAGYDVVSTSHGSYLGERVLEPSELRLLIDSVLCSKHVNPHHSRELAEKLSSLAGKHFHAPRRNIATVGERNKSETGELFYTIDVADEAIEAGRQLAFSYRKYGPDKRLAVSSEHVVSPYQMLLQNQHYYLMAYSTTYQKISYFRMDKIGGIRLLDSPAVPLRSLPGYENGIDYRRLSSALPYMFGDEPVPVTFLADGEVIDQVVDWFGLDSEIREAPKGRYRVTVRVSPRAMEYWAMQYAKHIRILSPADLRHRVAEDLRMALTEYEAIAEKGEK